MQINMHFGGKSLGGHSTPHLSPLVTMGNRSVNMISHSLLQSKILRIH